VSSVLVLATPIRQTPTQILTRTPKQRAIYPSVTQPTGRATQFKYPGKAPCVSEQFHSDKPHMIRMRLCMTLGGEVVAGICRLVAPMHSA
jgi:hypothetical protein